MRKGHVRGGERKKQQNPDIIILYIFCICLATCILLMFYFQPDEYSVYLHDSLVFYARTVNRSVTEGDTTSGSDILKWAPFILFKGNVAVRFIHVPIYQIADQRTR